MTLSVIIPVYNEVKTIQEIIRRVEATGLVDQIVAVDDGSTDGSRDILKGLDGQGIVKVIYHDLQSLAPASGRGKRLGPPLS